MSSPFTVALVQTNSAREIADNIPVFSDQVRRAADAGADLIALPECVALMEPKNRLLREKAPVEDGHPALEAFVGLARETEKWILAGTLAVKLEDGAIANRSYLLDAQGAIVARYDKIHMFDVDLGDGEVYRESATFHPGEDAVLAETPWGKLGLSVCYDVRFPALYRALAQAGADFLAVPAAFTAVTGRAHWHVLLRARAIETGCYVFAPAQCGTHAEGRRTFGHSLIVDPWGEVIADGGEAPGIVTAAIEPERIAEARRKVPSLQHDREFSLARSTTADRGANVADLPRRRRRAP